MGLRRRHLRGASGGLLGSGILQGQQCLGNCISNNIYGHECLGTGIRNTKFGYRCSKTGANRENVIRGDYLYGRRGALSGGIHTAISWQNGLDTNS